MKDFVLKVRRERGGEEGEGGRKRIIKAFKSSFFEGRISHFFIFFFSFFTFFSNFQKGRWKRFEKKFFPFARQLST